MAGWFRQPRFWLIWLALWLPLQSLSYPEISFIDGNMQNSVVDLSTALVEWGRVEIGPLHINSPDVAEREGKFYSGMAPGVSWLGVPCYALARMLAPHLPGALAQWIEREHARVIANPPRAWPGNIYQTEFYKQQIITHMLLTTLLGFMGGGVSVLLVFRMARALQLTPAAAVFAGAVYALGTPLLFYHASYYTQSVALLCLLVGMNLLFTPRASTLPQLFGGGLCLGLAGACDYPYFVYAGLVGLGFIAHQQQRRRLCAAVLGAVILGGLAPLLGVLMYHQAAFGGVLKTPYGFRYHMNYPHDHGLYGIRLPTVARVRALLLGPGEGLLTTAPVLLLAIPGLISAVLDRRVNRPLLALLVITTAVSACHFTSIPWFSTTAAYGPRFFLPGLLCLALLTGRAWPAWGGLALPLLLLGYLINAAHMLHWPPGNWLETTRWPEVLNLSPLSLPVATPGALGCLAIWYALSSACAHAIARLALRHLGGAGNRI